MGEEASHERNIFDYTLQEIWESISWYKLTKKMNFLLRNILVWMK